jgi:hypothetical protein
LWTWFNAGANVTLLGHRGKRLPSSFNGHCAIVKALLGAGADLNQRAGVGSCGTTLSAAASKGHMQVVQCCLSVALGSEAVGEEGGAPVVAIKADALHVMTSEALQSGFNGHGRVVRVLLATGADQLCRDRHCTTALSEAARGGHLALVQFFLSTDSGAEVHSVTAKGETLLLLASEAGPLPVVQFLVRAWVDLSPACRDSPVTAVMCAASAGRTEVGHNRPPDSEV